MENWTQTAIEFAALGLIFLTVHLVYKYIDRRDERIRRGK